MNLDRYYEYSDKENFYLGIISQVFKSNCRVQIENLSLLKSRKIRNEILVPNTINYLVAIEDVKGLFIGEVFQAKISDSISVSQSINRRQVDKIFPEIGINIIGYMKEDHLFTLPGFNSVGINDKVYVANKQIIQKYHDSLQIKKMKDQATLQNLASISNYPDVEFSIQPNAMFERHLLVLGATNSGKSVSSLVILDSLIQNKKKVLIIDPTGEYSESFKENNNVKKLTLGEDTILPVSSVTIPQWETLFQVNSNTQGSVLSDAIKSLRYQKANNKDEVYIKKGKEVTEVESNMDDVENNNWKNFDLSKLPEQIYQESVSLSKDLKKYEFSSFSANTNSFLKKRIKHVLDYSSLEDFFYAAQPSPEKDSSAGSCAAQSSSEKDSSAGSCAAQSSSEKDSSAGSCAAQPSPEKDSSAGSCAAQSSSEKDSSAGSCAAQPSPEKDSSAGSCAAQSSPEKVSLLDIIDEFRACPKRSLYINTSKIGLSDSIGTMIIDLISNHIIDKIDSDSDQPFVFFIDEVHRYIQESVSDISGLINIAREGRKKGIFLFLTTQSPNDLPKILFNQIGTLLVHRMTGQDDLQILKNSIDENSQKQIANLGQGEALLISVNLLKNVQLKFHKSDLCQKNETPVL